MQTRQYGHHAVHDAFRSLFPVHQDGRVGHQVAHVTDQQQGAAVQGQRGAVQRGILAIRVHGAGHGLAALLEGFLQIALHQAGPVAVHLDLVFRIHGSHGVFAVLDGGDGGFQQHILHVRRVFSTNRVAGVDLDFRMQVVVLEQDTGRSRRIAHVALQLGLVFQAALVTAQRHFQLAIDDGVASAVLVGAAGQGEIVIQEVAGPGDYLGATLGVVGTAFLGAAFIGNHVGAVQGIVQAAPAGIGRVQGEAGILHRYHQLRAGDGADLVIHILGGDLEVVAFRQQVADLGQELLVLGHVDGLAFTGLVPLIQLRLDGFTLFQQRLVLGRQVLEDAFQLGPEVFRVHAGARRNLVDYQIMEFGSDFEATLLNTIGHGAPTLLVERVLVNRDIQRKPKGRSHVSELGGNRRSPGKRLHGHPMDSPAKRRGHFTGNVAVNHV